MQKGLRKAGVLPRISRLMIVIRLQRTGRKNLPSYRIVVAQKERAVKGKFLEIIGHYLPQRENPVFKVEQDRVQDWVKRGAIPSDTLARLLRKNGMKDMEKFIQRYTKQKSKKAVEEEANAPAPDAAAPAPVAAAPTEAPAQAASGDTEAKPA